MDFLRQWPARWMAPLALALFGLLVSASYYAFESRQSLDMLWKDRERQLMERLGIEQTRIDRQAGSANWPLVRRLVTGLALHQDLDQAYLVASDGQILVSMSRLDVGKTLPALDAPVARWLHERAARRSAGIVVQADRPAQRLLGWVPLAQGGQLAVSVNLERGQAVALYEARRESAVAAVMMLVLSAALAWLLHVLWFRRSAHLVDRLGRIAAGDRSVPRADMAGGDEIALIGQAVDGMVHRLASGEAELRRMVDIVNRSPVVLIEWRNAPGWPVGFVSEAVAQWGYRPEELQDGAFRYDDLFHPDDALRVNEEIATYFRVGPDSYRQEYRLRRSDGEWAYVIDSSTLSRDAAGQVTGITGLLLDVTAQKRAEEEVRQQADRLARFYEMPFIGMAMTSPKDKRWIQVNDRLCEIMGHSREYLLATSWVEFTHPDDVDDNLVLFQDLLANRRQNYRMIKRFIRGDGQVVHAEMDVRARRRPDGTVSEIYTTIQDITDRLHAEADLRRLGAMADNASDALMLTVDGRFEDCNAAGVRLYGCPDKATLLGRSPADFSPAFQADGRPSLAAAQAYVGAAMAGLPQYFEWLHCRLDGTVFEAEVSLNRFQMADGRFALIGVVRDISGRKQQEARLRESEALLREAQRVGQMGSWSIDLSTRRVVWSDETYRMQGMDPRTDAASFEAFVAVIHPDDREAVVRIFEMSVAQHLPYNARYRICLPDGRIRHMHAQGETDYLDGVARRSVGMVRDETDLVEAQAALLLERERLAEAQTVARIGSWSVDLPGGAVSWSEANFRVLGLDPKTCVPSVEAYLSVVHPDDQERVRAHVAESMRWEPRQANDVRWIEHRIVTPDGIRHVEERSHVQRDADGAIVRLYGTTLDVTERVEASRALQETSAMLEQGEALALIGSWTFDSDTRQLHWSRQMFANMGLPWSPRPPSVDAYCACVHPDDVPEVRALIDRLLSAREVPEIRFRTHPDRGAVRWLHRVVQQFDRSGEGKGPYYLGTLLDVTRAVHAEERLRAINEQLEQRVAERTAQLQDINRDLEAFTYSVSHDLKAPLRGIDGYSQLLVEDYGPRLGEEGQMFVERIRRGVAQMGLLISDLLDYSRMERRSMEPHALDIVALADQVIEGFEADIARQGVQVRRQMEPVTLTVDREGMAVVLRNLIGNAIKFSADRAHPQVEIGSRVGPDRIRLWVRDNGVGFDMQYHDRIFAIFQRLHRAEDFPGTGIGLALVAKAVQRMGGKVWAESRPGDGATFYMEFPR
ncbi:MAG: PAS domain-containing protein [Burkholderiaceae bacterium]